MKSRWIASGGDANAIARKVAREEIEKQKATVCPACEQNIGNQVTAMLLKVLHDEYGFGKQRLKNVIECTEGLFMLCSLDGKRYKAIDCVEWLKDTMGIDLNKGE